MNLLELLNEKIDKNQKHLEVRLESIDKNLEEHMRRTDVLEQLHKDNEKRIMRLEKPFNWFSVTWKVILGILGVAVMISRIKGDL